MSQETLIHSTKNAAKAQHRFSKEIADIPFILITMVLKLKFIG
jgi:hypothetical protein